MKLIDWIISNVFSKMFKLKNNLKLAELNPRERAIWLAINNTSEHRSNKWRWR